MQTEGIQQKYLRKAGLIALITVLGMTPPLSTDMYMPSLPKMADYFGAAPVVVNMTMVAFFISMSVGMLIMGPLSDRSGRKSVLIISLLLYMIASVFCAITSSVYFLILMRIVQGIGSLPWGSYIKGIGITIVGFLILALAAWLYVLKSRWRYMNNAR